jgi:hypothetical protein
MYFPDTLPKDENCKETKRYKRSIHILNTETRHKESSAEHGFRFEDCRRLGCDAVCGSCNNGRFWGTCRFHRRDGKNHCSVLQLLVAANIVPSLPISSTLKETISSSETSVPTRPTRCHITAGDIHHSYRRENLKCYIGSALFMGLRF